MTVLCFACFSAVSAYAYIGAHDLFTIEEGRMVMFSDTFVEHPDYRTDQISNDIALVKLPKKITYTGMFFDNFKVSLAKLCPLKVYCGWSFCYTGVTRTRVKHGLPG